MASSECVELRQQLASPATYGAGFRRKRRHALVVPPAIASEMNVTAPAARRTDGKLKTTISLE
jgi:hypothetical protein